MTLRNLLMLALAALFGFLGGLFSRSAYPEVSVATAELIRAKRYELLDMSGRSIAFWGRSQGRTVLVFEGNDGKELAAFGLHYPQEPYFELYGKDGRSRAAIQLAADDLPVLALSDARSEGRVLFGAIQGEQPYPDPLEANWALVFRGVDHRERAAISMVYDTQRRLSGSVSVRKGDGKPWSAP